MADNQAARWQRLEEWFRTLLGKQPNMEAILFLIGVRELGSPPKEFEKEEKMELMHIAICRLLSQSGYYELSHLDQDGWPHWKLVKELPHQDMFSQVHLLREHILTYFEEEEIFKA
ncbi:MAG: hypothetical protein AAF927_21470 [Bacteroidota bacterium]